MKPLYWALIILVAVATPLLVAVSMRLSRGELPSILVASALEEPALDPRECGVEKQGFLHYADATRECDLNTADNIEQCIVDQDITRLTEDQCRQQCHEQEKCVYATWFVQSDVAHCYINRGTKGAPRIKAGGTQQIWVKKIE
jgi:hypothetical protein